MKANPLRLRRRRRESPVRKVIVPEFVSHGLCTYPHPRVDSK